MIGPEHVLRGTDPSRRTLLAGAIWATPVVMGVTAAPAYAASGDVVMTEAAVAATNLYAVKWWEGHTIAIWSAQVQYDANKWGTTNYETDTPLTAVTTWVVTIEDTASNWSFELEQENQSIARGDGGREIRGKCISVPGPGTYEVTVKVTSVTFIAPVVKGVTFVNDYANSGKSTTVTV